MKLAQSLSRELHTKISFDMIIKLGGTSCNFKEFLQGMSVIR